LYGARLRLLVPQGGRSKGVSSLAGQSRLVIGQQQFVQIVLFKSS